MSEVTLVAIDDTRLRKGQNCITVEHDLNAKRLRYSLEGHYHQTVVNFAADLKAHGGESTQIKHVCQDLSATDAKGDGTLLTDAQINSDRFHVIAMANQTMDGVRRTEMSTLSQAVKVALGDRKLLKRFTWGMRRNPQGLRVKQINAMHWLQHSTLKSASAWRLKMALWAVYAKAEQDNDGAQAKEDLSSWINWTRRSRLKSFKKLAENLHQRLDAVVLGMLDNRCNAYVEATIELLQQAMRAAIGLRMASHFIAIAYSQMSKLKHFPSNPLLPAVPQSNVMIHRCR